MNKQSLWLGPLVLVLAGCTDTVDSVSREYRNMNNEVIDAMSMVTSEARAGQMMVRIFKPMNDRYTLLDKKLSNIRANRDKKPFVKETFESDGVQVYLTDLQVNRQRFALELIRLRALYNQVLEKEQKIDPTITPQKACPNLYDLIGKGDEKFQPLRKQLTNPDLLGMMLQFPGWKVEGYDDMYMKFAAKRPAFVPVPEIVLVN